MKDPAILFYTGDFLTGCQGLTMEERGQYITMLCIQHQSGRLSDKTIRLTVGSVSVDVMTKFKTDENGLYFNERMESEILKRTQFVDSRKVNGAKGGRPKNSKKPYAKPYGKAKHNLHENENINENDNINIIEDKIDFEFFWNEYNKKVGDKKKCLKKWNKLDKNTQEHILESLPDFISQFIDKQYQPHPETYLNQQRWNDEIIIKNNINGTHKPSNKEACSWEQLAEITQRASAKIAS